MPTVRARLPGRAATVVLALAFAAVARAQAELLQVPAGAVRHVARQWDNGNGLPQSTVNAVAQTGDGYLWIATFGGLCRFDGGRMVTFDSSNAPALRTNRFTSLCEGRDGTLWIGSDRAGLFVHRGERFRAIDALHDARISCLAEDRDGRLAVGTPEGLFVGDGDTLAPWHPAEVRVVQHLLRRGSGELLAATDGGVFAVDTTPPRRLAGARTFALLEVGEQLLAGTEHGVFVVRDGALERWRPAAAIDCPVYAAMLARDGAVWVGTERGAVRIDAAVVATSALPEPPGDAPESDQVVRALCEDREGGVWIGETQHGLTRLRPAEMFCHDVTDGLPQRGLVSAVDDGRGGVWVGTDNGLWHGRGGVFAEVEQAKRFGPVRTVWRDPDDTLWFSSRDGLIRLGRDEPECVVAAQPWGTNLVRAIVRGHDGALWLGGEPGIARFAGDGLSVPPALEPLRGRMVRSLAFAPDGALWAGGVSEVVRIAPDGGGVRWWHAGSGGLPFGEVRGIVPEAGERAWVAVYGGGAVRIDGERCTIVDEAHGLQDQSVCAMLTVGDAFLLAGNHGVSLVARADLDAVVAGRSTTVGCRVIASEGARVAECNGGMQACVSERDGVVFVCGVESLFELDLRRVAPLERALAVNLDALYFGERLAGAGLEHDVPAGVRSATLRLGVCAFENRERVRYRWRLTGVHQDWSEPTLDPEVRLASLPSGALRFQAEAIDLDGRASAAPLEVWLRVPPLLWETELFWFGVGLFGAVGAVLLMHLGASRQARRAAQLQGLVDERTRELRAAHHQLEDRVAERTQELQQALERQAAEAAERQRLERQVQQLERMESVGQLAGGIAHDFNNLLTVTAGAGQLLEMEVTTPDGQALCQSIAAACERGKRMTQHLLAVASRQLVTVEHLDLDRVVADTLPVLRSLLADDVRLRFVAAGGGAFVRAAVTQIEQILLNLAANARDAMPRGGDVAIAVAVVAGRVRLSVRDNGVGMPAAVVERVFEPFFTTKQRGAGRGLGLATVFGITKQLGGQIRVDSAVGAGTTIHIELPQAEPVVVPPAAPPAPVERAVQRRTANVLLVEDEADVRAIVERLLRDLGCTVHVAADGEQAIAQLRRRELAVDVVISDVVMPGLQGARLVEAMHAVRPGLPIVFLTGYLDGRATHQELTAMGLDVLPKPVDQAHLAAALHKLLDPARRRTSDA